MFKRGVCISTIMSKNKSKKNVATEIVATPKEPEAVRLDKSGNICIQILAKVVMLFNTYMKIILKSNCLLINFPTT